MQIGISSFAFAWSIGVPGFQPDNPMTAEQLLSIAAELGADCVQLADNIPLHHFKHKELDQLRTQAQKLGLSLEVGMRGLIPAVCETYLQIADFLGSKILRVVIDSENYHPTLPEICQVIMDMLPMLKGKRIFLAIENHDRFSSSQFREIIEQTDPTWIGICLDSVNSLGKGEGFHEVFSQLQEYAVNVHIKDYLITRKPHQMGFDVSGSIAGKGMLPIPQILQRLKALGKCQSAILESWPPWDIDLNRTIEKEKEWAEKGMKFLLQTNRQGVS